MIYIVFHWYAHEGQDVVRVFNSMDSATKFVAAQGISEAMRRHSEGFDIESHEVEE